MALQTLPTVAEVTTIVALNGVVNAADSAGCLPIFALPGAAAFGGRNWPPSMQEQFGDAA